MEPFEFKQYTSILKSTGVKAKSLRELRDAIGSVSAASLFHHTCQYFLKGGVLEYTNDFAHWAGESIEERELSEQLSIVDPYVHGSIEGLRAELLGVLDEYIARFPEPRAALKGDEFYFNESRSIVCPSGMRAANPAEFLLAIKYADAATIYYHFYEARARLGADDFSSWILGSLGNDALAARIKSIDPFMHSIEEIRERIVVMIEDEVKSGMMRPGGPGGVGGRA